MTHKSIRNNNKQTEDDTTDSELDLTGTVMTAFYIGLFTEKGLGFIFATFNYSFIVCYFILLYHGIINLPNKRNVFS